VDLDLGQIGIAAIVLLSADSKSSL